MECQIYFLLRLCKNMAEKNSIDDARLGKRLNPFIKMFEYGLLQDVGKVTAEIAKRYLIPNKLLVFHNEVQGVFFVDWLILNFWNNISNN